MYKSSCDISRKRMRDALVKSFSMALKEGNHGTLGRTRNGDVGSRWIELAARSGFGHPATFAAGTPLGSSGRRAPGPSVRFAARRLCLDFINPRPVARIISSKRRPLFGRFAGGGALRAVGCSRYGIRFPAAPPGRPPPYLAAVLAPSHLPKVP